MIDGALEGYELNCWTRFFNLIACAKQRVRSMKKAKAERRDG